MEKGGGLVMVAVMYVFKEKPAMTLDIYEPLLNLVAIRHSLKVEGVYADGFEVPRGEIGVILSKTSRKKVLLRLSYLISPNGMVNQRNSCGIFSPLSMQEWR